MSCLDLEWSGFYGVLWDVIWCWGEVEWFLWLNWDIDCVVIGLEKIEGRGWIEIGLWM